MKLRWFGTAGFQVDTGGGIFLIDPYLSRNPRSKPVQTMLPPDITGAAQIFISHGHFDHLSDVPHIMDGNPATVYCSVTAGDTLARKRVNSARICRVTEDGYTVDFGHYRAQAFFSRHIKFDLPLVARTLKRIGRGALPLLHMHTGYPMGQVLTWRFTIGHYTIQHFGSAGASRAELERLAGMPLDLLLLPLQGHTQICNIAMEYVRMLRPRTVIPHHHDDFYPPISDGIDISAFVYSVRESCPGTDVRVMKINDSITV